MPGKDKIRVGHGQADVSRRGAPGLTKKDKLKLGRAAAKNLVVGTIEKNTGKRQKPFLPVD